MKPGRRALPTCSTTCISPTNALKTTAFASSLTRDANFSNCFPLNEPGPPLRTSLLLRAKFGSFPLTRSWSISAAAVTAAANDAGPNSLAFMIEVANRGCTGSFTIAFPCFVTLYLFRLLSGSLYSSSAPRSTSI